MDSADDMTFGQQQANFLRDSPDAVAQVVKTRLRLLSGEWYLDLSEGVAYQVSALGTGTRSTAGPMFRTAILECPGVLEITAFDTGFEPESRTFTLAATIDTIYGAVALSTVL